MLHFQLSSSYWTLMMHSTHHFLAETKKITSGTSGQPILCRENMGIFWLGIYSGKRLAVFWFVPSFSHRVSLPNFLFRQLSWACVNLSCFQMDPFHKVLLQSEGWEQEIRKRRRKTERDDERRRGKIETCKRREKKKGRKTEEIYLRGEEKNKKKRVKKIQREQGKWGEGRGAKTGREVNSGESNRK